MTGDCPTCDQPLSRATMYYEPRSLLILRGNMADYYAQLPEMLKQRDKLLAECSYELRLFHCVELADRIDALLKGTP